MITNSRPARSVWLVLWLWLLVAGQGVAAVQEEPQEEAAESARSEPSSDAASPAETASAPENNDRALARIVENSDRQDGLFTIYRDRNTGVVHLGLRPEQLDREYIYLAVTADGAVPASHFRGNYRDNRIISLRRHFDRIELRAENTSFYFDPENPLSRAASANVSDAVLAVARIRAEDSTSGEILIRADDFLLDESLHQVRPTSASGNAQGFRLGDLNRDRTRVVEVRNYPANLAAMVEYVYRNPAPSARGGADITDPRNVSVYLWHHFVPLPDNAYQPRVADFRLGHFAERVTDLTSDRVTPYRDLIQRWHLVKREPEAALSEPVRPIVWWIENTTPHEFRDVIRDAILAWNRAFERIGFSNAIEVRVQPDDADWDAGDLRYNVVRWASSPNPAFAGYGPSFTNPRTGQILGADVMLEFSSVARRVQHQRILDGLQASAVVEEQDHEHTLVCSLAHELQASQVFGRFAIGALGMDPELEEQLVREYLTMLTLHEIGHTLGFTHNFAASQMRGLDEMHGQEVAETGVLAGSVMDYHDIHLPPPGRERTRFFQTDLGPYDHWIVEYSYSGGLADVEAERKRLAAIAGRSTEPGLAFGNDSDDMRTPGRALDPRVNLYDMSNDAIGYALERIELVNELLERAAYRHVRDGESYHELADAYTVLLSQYNRSVAVISRYVGGVEVSQVAHGQPAAQAPFVPIAAGEQRRAMQALAEYLFAPGAFSADSGLYSHLQRQRRQFDFSGARQDPLLHEWMLAMQRNVLDHLLHPTVLRRVNNTRLYGNEFTLGELMEGLTDAVFAADLLGNVDSFRQNLQLEYVTRLARVMTGSAYDYPTQSMALYQLRSIQGMLHGKHGGDLETRAHTESVLFAIERAIEAARSS